MFVRAAGLGFVVVMLWCVPLPAADKPEAPKTRDFLFVYQATVTGLKPEQTARIWLPAPPSNDEQEVTMVTSELPAEGKIDREPRFGNKILYLEAKADKEGKIALSVTYRVIRKEVKTDWNAKSADGKDLEAFLRPDAKVPIDGKPLTLIEGKKLPADAVDRARVLYDAVNSHMRYSKEGTGWGQGDSVWACENKYGNCTDFHSLFISLARAQKIPAYFEIGFQLPAKRGAGEIPGYHCWAKFKPPGKSWTPVDISEANKNPKLKDYCFGNLTEDRVAFSSGRDLVLAPKQDGPPLNFFVYPYVEVAGKTYPAEKVQQQFTFKDK